MIAKTIRVTNKSTPFMPSFIASFNVLGPLAMVQLPSSCFGN